MHSPHIPSFVARSPQLSRAHRGSSESSIDSAATCPTSGGWYSAHSRFLCATDADFATGLELAAAVTRLPPADVGEPAAGTEPAALDLAGTGGSRTRGGVALIGNGGLCRALGLAAGDIPELGKPPTEVATP